MQQQILIALFVVIAIPLNSQHYEFSNGLYRIGYEDNVVIDVFSDVYTHDPLGKYDILTSSNDPDIVAAAPGWKDGLKKTILMTVIPKAMEIHVVGGRIITLS